MVKGKKIILCVTGSIAAYKSAILVRLLIKAGADVKVIMTSAASNFIAPLTFSTLSKNDVLSALSDNETWANHVSLGRWADIILVAPLSCNTLSKMANGACDNLLLAVYLSATCPVVVAPAMDEDMWIHPATRANIQKLLDYGNMVIPVNNGELASGLMGPGRMAEPEEILAWLDLFFKKKTDLAGKRVVVTAGPTYEPIDPVRFIGNHSSGKMGIAIAEECAERGAAVTLILGPSNEVYSNRIRTVRVRTAEEMYDATLNLFNDQHIAILCAAVADYTPLEPKQEKIKKQDGELVISLKKTKDILMTLGGLKKPGQFVAGFALETNNEKEYALAKLHKKNADMIVLNSLQDKGASFGSDNNKITIFDKAETEYSFEMKPKKLVAADIVNTLIKLAYV